MNTRVPLDSNQPEFWAMINNLGKAALIETLRSAAFYVTHSNCSTRSHTFKVDFIEAEACYLYVQGTGLSILINKFNLEYDPEEMKNSFNYCIRRSA